MLGRNVLPGLRGLRMNLADLARGISLGVRLRRATKRVPAQRREELTEWIMAEAEKGETALLLPYDALSPPEREWLRLSGFEVGSHTQSYYREGWRDYVGWA